MPRTSPDPRRPFWRRTDVLTFAAVLLAASCLIGAPCYFLADWVPESTRERIPGATRDEVRAMLGEPDDIGTGTDYERWYYRRPLRMAEFRVDFEMDGRSKTDGSYDR
jgi:hypothetical protein